MQLHNGKGITRLHPTGYYQFYSDTEKRFLTFDDLDECKAAIDRETTPAAPQVIVRSVWKTKRKGLWYANAWALDQGTVLDPLPRYSGYRSQEKAKRIADELVSEIHTSHPHTKEFPVVDEHSPEWKRLVTPSATA